MRDVISSTVCVFTMQKHTQGGADGGEAKRYDLKNSVVSQQTAMLLMFIAGGATFGLSFVQMFTPNEPGLYLVAAVVAFAAVAFVVSAQPKTTLGADGIYTKWINRTHYVALSDITDVTRTVEEKPPTLHVWARKAGREVVVKYQGTDEEIRRFEDDLQDLRDRANPTDDDLGAERFARGKLRVADWIEGVKGVVDARGGHYRAITIPRERVLSYAIDATLPPDVRAGAAIALAPNADPKEKEALLRIAASTASPALQRVFEGAARNQLPAESLDEIAESERPAAQLRSRARD